jgi:hypothetical protein
VPNPRAELLPLVQPVPKPSRIQSHEEWVRVIAKFLHTTPFAAPVETLSRVALRPY